MRKTAIIITLSFLAFLQANAQTEHVFTIQKDQIHSGYVTKKVWLDHYSMPEVKLKDLSYATSGIVLPLDAIPSDPNKFDIMLGKDRKRPFALVSLPVYSLDGDSRKIKQLSAFTVTIKEKPGAEPAFSYSSQPRAAKGTAASSPLASGSWYKIAVSETGFYKIDYTLLSQMGVNPANINPANIRVFGNGGHMLSEDNAIPRPDDLTENAIWVNDGGDNKFDQGDYVVFYAVGPTAWTKDPSSNTFRHLGNLYDDKAYYFINFDASGLRIATQTDIPQSNVTVSSYNDHQVHEEDLVNVGGFGKQWWGEAFSSGPGGTVSNSFNFDLGNTVDSARFHIVVGSRSAAVTNTMKINVNGHLEKTVIFNSQAGQSDEQNAILEMNADFNMLQSGATNVTLTYSPYSTDDKAYLDYIEINTRRALSFSGIQFSFRDLNSVGAGNKAQYQVGNANGGTQVWDITNPLVPMKMDGTLNGSTYSFSQYADTLHEFAAFNNSSQLPVPEFAGTVDNQNLHGSGQADLIIVTDPDFVDAANALADFHTTQDHMRVAVATTTQVYNEFSSGSKDISAIRDFARMYYKRAGNDTTQMPKYLLLIGDASYDPKDRVTNNNDRVPIYESIESHYLTNSFCNDDFFGMLDDNENISASGIANTLDVGVGRFPVNSEKDAMAMVDKIKHYKSTASLGPWRLQDMFVADNEDPAGPHMSDADYMSQTVGSKSNIYNHTKVFLDALPTVSSPGGARCPQANKIIDDQMYKGCFFVNYSGHGNTTVWSAKRILTEDDYNGWTNYDNMPFMVTATCDFGRFDQPSYVSAGEALVIKNNGGVIVALTTTQLVFAAQNRTMNHDFLEAQFTHLANNKWYRFGDAFRIGKNQTYQVLTDPNSLVNFRKFALLGDPALLPDFPQYTVMTDSIKNTGTSLNVDTVSALGSYVVYGSVRGDNNEVLTDFNGKLYVSYYDKPRTTDVTTYNGAKSFQTQNNIIYKGRATVTNGQFSYTFIVPKDINYEFGKGKLSSYAENGITDAAGDDTSFVLGGYADDPVTDDNPPIVKPYIGDSLFKDGGITGANTLLYVSLEDETGINVSGNAVGHDLTAVMDGNIDVPYILNDYYETEPNTYQKGHVYFPLSNLSVGKHTIVVKAWDVNNNSGEGVVNFEVIDGDVVKLQDLINYPNPFKDVTHFFFEHNHPDEALNVEINIYNTAGLLVRKIRQSFTPSNSRSNEITWDGTSDGGAKLPAGVYVYRVNVATATGAQSSAYQKLVLLR